MAGQQEYMGAGSIGRLRDILALEKPQKIFMVQGKSSYQSSGAQEKIEPLLSPYRTAYFSDFSANPKIEDIRKGMQQFRKEEYDLVLAVGGGSVLDMAKAINILSAQTEEPEKYIRSELPLQKKGKPLIAIPTTSGTGSEATHFLVAYIGKQKYSLAHPKFILPDHVILDPILTVNLPPKTTASTGMDALAQAVESYWSVHSTEESREYAHKAIPLILKNLPTAVNHPSFESRAAMMQAANLAGKAINISFTTACHAISYPLTSYFNVPHGQAVALTLGDLFVYNSHADSNTTDDCIDPRGKEHLHKIMQELTSLFQVHSAEEAKQKIQHLLAEIGLETRLSALGITAPEDIDCIIEHGFNPQRAGNNPRKLTPEALRKILENLA